VITGPTKTEILSQKLDYGNAAKKNAVAGCLGSRGATDAIAGYRDNDITANLVNAKHINPAVLNPPRGAVVAKAQV